MEKNKVISINENDVYIQASNNDKVFVIDRYVYDNFWDSELSKHSWMCNDNRINNYKGISLAKKICELYNIDNVNNNYVCLINKPVDGLYDLRINNIRINKNNYIFINDSLCIGKAFNGEERFLIDAALYPEISKYNWYQDISNNGSIRFRSYINGKHTSMRKFILSLLKKHFNTACTNFNNAPLIYDEYGTIHDFRAESLIYKNTIVRITDDYVFIKCSNSADVFIIDRFIYDYFWYYSLSKYSWYAHEGYVNGWINGDSYKMHRVIMILLGIDISNHIIHHINGCKMDNRLENLLIISEYQHLEIHTLQDKGYSLQIHSNIFECINNGGVIPFKYSTPISVNRLFKIEKECNNDNPFIFY